MYSLKECCVNAEVELELKPDSRLETILPVIFKNNLTVVKASFCFLLSLSLLPSHLDLPIYLYLFVNLSIHLSLPLSYILECHRWLLLMRRPRRDRRSGPRGSSTEASSFIPVSSSLIPRLVLCFAFIFLLFCKQENCRDEGFCDLRLSMFRNIRFQIRIHCIWPDPDPLQSSLRIRISLRFLFPDPDPLKALIWIRVAPKQTKPNEVKSKT